MHQVIEWEPGFANGAERVGPHVAIPLVLTWKGAQANLQNETAPGSEPGSPMGKVRKAGRAVESAEE